MNIKQIRKIALFLLWIFLGELLAPSLAFCLTSGPNQPEVSSFTPIHSTEMVDLFTGDLNYNIPLLDVGGYPINIGYHSGIGMDQEASWTGLGWNINVGAVTRNVRGIPDDFKGEFITRKLHMLPNKTYGVHVGAGLELAGKETKAISSQLQYTLGAKYNNFYGLGIEKSLHLGLSVGMGSKYKMNGGLGLHSSSDEGLTIQPTLGLSRSIFHSDQMDTRLGLHLGLSFNSQAGLKNLSMDTHLAIQYDQGGASQNSFHIAPSSGAIFNQGLPTYTPQLEIPLWNYSFTGNFKLGNAYFALHPNASLGGYYSAQELVFDEVSNPAFGYMYSGAGQIFPNAVLDFNREKEIPFSRNTTDLPIPNLTYDIYSFTAHGGGGSFRPFRGDVGHVFDPYTYTSSDGGSASEEIGIGNVFHAGADIAETHVFSASGDWTQENMANASLTFKDKNSNPFYEASYFKDATEKTEDTDPTFMASIGGYIPQKIGLKKNTSFHILANNKYIDKHGVETPISYLTVRKKRENRKKLISTLKYDEMSAAGLQAFVNQHAKAHHIAEITSLGTDGKRFVYGLPVYNFNQEEVSFSVGQNLYGEVKARKHDAHSGLVFYNTLDDSKENKMGIDNYYSHTILPPYAYAYLLTAVLSPDYADADNIRGPSDFDIGDYTLFGYKKMKAFNWRIPYGEHSASYNEVLKTDLNDDRASYLYGQKEIYYPDTIKTKNYLAIFYTSNREDACGVHDKSGKMDTTVLLQKLDSISLFVKDEFYHKRINGKFPVALKKVHFEYDYSLCPGIPNNLHGEGKLTLKKIYFSFGNSNLARLSPYAFSYHAFNPSYNLKGYDRWGNYKNNDHANDDPLASAADMPNSEYPYVLQDKSLADQNANAWSLEKIYLPSGGIIKIRMESDDYAYVQNKRAMQMFPIFKTSNSSQNLLTDISDEHSKLYFQGKSGTQMKDYIDFNEKIYFRFLMELTPGHFEYISGYGDLDTYGFDSATGEGYVQMKPVFMNDKSGIKVSPIAKAALQFLRLHKPKWAWGEEISGEPSMGKDFLNAMLASSFVKNIKEVLEGPNQSLYSKGYCHKAIMNKSWIRLNNPTKKKLGGGSRIAEIRMDDHWNEMTAHAENSFEYGRLYEYALDDGTSSGVACYEPLIGGDENPFRKPVFFSEEHLLAPDDEHYLEEPFGESFFPAPSVGYSRVAVRNIPIKHVKRHAAGKSVYEFYTSKDFPIITDRTPMEHIEEKSNPFSLFSLFHISSKNYLTATQGYTIELNDMNGKPRSEKMYKEDSKLPFHSVEYTYQCKPYLQDSYRLDNVVTVVESNGDIRNSEIGVFSDVFSDMREQTTAVTSSSISPNIDAFVLMGYPLILGMIWPSEATEKTQFRSAVQCKVFQKSGLLKQVLTFDDGAIQMSENLAYDAESGEVILTSIVNDFNDPIYSIDFPAYWYYREMGLASRNTGLLFQLKSSGSRYAYFPKANEHFIPGDEILFTQGNSFFKGWISQVLPDSITVIDRVGKFLTSGNYDGKIIRSGFKNQVTADMQKLLLKSNPLFHLSTNSFENILQASAVEFLNKKKSFCNCLGTANINLSINPFVNGLAGSWLPFKSYTYLSDRSRSSNRNFTDIRNDGIFSDFSAFFKIRNHQWEKDPLNWTYTNELTELSASNELERKDALGIFNSNVYGYKHSLPIAVATNAQYREIGVDNFEDYHLQNCADNHFKFKNTMDHVVTAESHSGRYCMKVGMGKSAELYRNLNTMCMPEKCNLSFVETDIDLVKKHLEVKNASQPIHFEWNVLYGKPDFQLLDQSPIAESALMISQKNWEADIIAIDSKGCQIQKKISH